MSLAQVVYHITNNAEFAEKWRKDPQAALQDKGFQLSREELNFLCAGLGGNSQSGNVRLSELAIKATSWM